MTVICLCYNQGKFVREALLSVAHQTYPHVELIIVDDGSTDGSVQEINSFLSDFPGYACISLPVNGGMCAAFNQGLGRARGEFIIDLAADDVLLPHRIARQIEVFLQLDPSWGVLFTDAGIIDEASRPLGNFYQRHPDGSPQKSIPSGDVYSQILKGYFICTPTMMSRRAVYEELGGYDESLCYEDFDFWIRSARSYKYFFLDEVLTLKRRTPGSDSTRWYRRRHNPHLVSTLKVCEKAYLLNRNEDEHQALAQAVRYHLRQALFMENFGLAQLYGSLLKKLDDLKMSDKLFLALAKYQIPLFPLYQAYARRRFAIKLKG